MLSSCNKLMLTPYFQTKSGEHQWKMAEGEGDQNIHAVGQLKLSKHIPGGSGKYLGSYY